MRKRIISVVLIICFCICTLGNYSVAKADEGQTAAEVVADISIGWSLGNSLACCDVCQLDEGGMMIMKEWVSHVMTEVHIEEGKRFWDGSKWIYFDECDYCRSQNYLNEEH